MKRSLTLEERIYNDKFGHGVSLVAKCCVCEKPTSGSLEFCQRCFQQNKTDITDKKPWVRALKNDAQRERRRREREFDNVSLDAIIDNASNRDR